MNGKPLILIIEDDPAIRRIFKANLPPEEFESEETAFAEGGLSLTASLRPDVVILDLGLPDGDGVDLIEKIRAISQVPILVLSARDNETEKVRALEAGANDYITKPFGLAEFKARIRVALRQPAHPKNKGSLQFDDLSVDLDARRVRLGTEEVHLTRLEYRLLMVMVHHPGKILTGKYLLKEVWGSESDGQKHYVRILTAGLRKKLERDPSRPQFIHTESGVGYRFFT